MKLNKIAQAVILASCFVSAAASATTLSKTYTSNIIQSTPTDLASVLDFTKFNGSLGTLTSVSFDLYANVEGTVKLTNYYDDEAIVPVSLSVDVSLSRPDHSMLTLYSASLLNQDVTVAGNDTATMSGSYSTPHNAVFYGNSDLALFTGTGNISTQFAVKAYTQADGEGVFADFQTKAGGYGVVTYTYTTAPVPEPETYGMLLAGLALMGVVAKRKSRKA